MKKGLLILFFLFNIIIQVSSYDFSGKVIDHRDMEIPDATVVVIEIDEITLTNENGEFDFFDIPEGEYTLLVVAPGFVEDNFKISIPSKDYFILKMEPETIEMEEIEIVEIKKEMKKPGESTVTKEELERQPVGSDPFDASAYESGIIESDKIDIVIPGTRAFNFRRSRTKDNRISVYGGDSDWNTYYYDYIRIPINKHAYGYPEPPAVIPVEAVEKMDIFKGVIPVALGPGIGGLFKLTPLRSYDEGFNLTLTPSIADLSGLLSWEFSDNSGLLFSICHSVAQWTILPLLKIVMEASPDAPGSLPLSFSYGDMLAHIYLQPQNHSISIDLLVFYDFFSLEEDPLFEFSITANQSPYFLAGGIKWSYSPGIVYTNTLYFYASMFQEPFDLHIDINTETESQGPFVIKADTENVETVSVLDFGDSFILSLTDNILLTLGINTRYASLYGMREEYYYMDVDSETQESSTPRTEFKEDQFKLYGYSNLQLNYNIISGLVGAALLYYPLVGTIRPALEGEIGLDIGNLWLSARAGWSAGQIDEFVYIDRRLEEESLELETQTTLETPPMAVSIVGQLLWILNDDNHFGLSPYFSWYYDLSGLAMDTSYTNFDRELIMLDPERGFSTGAEFAWDGKFSSVFNMKLSYNLAWTRYDTGELGWVYPNTDVRHTLKMSSSFTPVESIKLALNFIGYMDYPFTPMMVEESEGAYILVMETYNSARDLLPRLDISTNFTWDFKLFNLDWSIFYNSPNFLLNLNPLLMDLKDDLKESPGASTSKYENRKYVYNEYFLFTLLQAEIGFSITF